MRPPDPERLAAYLDGDLPPAAREAFLADLGAGARADVALLEAALAELEALPEAEPPAGLAEAVMARLPLPPRARARRWLTARPLLGWRIAGVAVAAAAALGLAATLGADLFGMRRDTDRPAAGGTNAPARFALRAPDARTVALVGSFNGWRADDLRLERGADGVWTIEVPLARGRHEYMFVVDGRVWVADPGAPAFRDDGFGRRNAVIDL